MCSSCLIITPRVGLLCSGRPSGSVWWWPGCMVKICIHANTGTVIFFCQVGPVPESTYFVGSATTFLTNIILTKIQPCFKDQLELVYGGLAFGTETLMMLVNRRSLAWLN